MVQRAEKLGRESRTDEDFNDRVTVPVSFKLFGKITDPAGKLNVTKWA